MKNKIFFTAGVVLLLMLPNYIFAQTDSEKDLGDENVKVFQDYNPIVGDAVKINYSPTLPDIKADKKPLTYRQPTKVVPITYQSISVKPLGIAKERAKDYASSHIKLGFGTQLSPLVELLFNEGKAAKNKGKFEKLNYGLFFKHLSANATKLDHQNFMDNRAKVFTNFFFKKSRLNTEFEFDQHTRFYYGYNHSDTTFSRDEVRQNYQNYTFNTSLLNTTIEKSDFSYNAVIDGYYYKDRFDKNEFDINFNLNLQKIIKNFHYATIDVYEDYSIYNNGNTDLNRNIFAVEPKYMFNDQTWRVFGGANLVWENSTFHVLPDFGMERSLWNEYIILFTGWKIELDKNSFKSLSTANPYINNNFMLFNSRTESRFISLKGTVANNLTYNIKFAQKIIRRLPLFVNDTTDTRKFEIIYDSKPIILNVSLELDYRVSEALNFHFSGEFNNYEPDKTKKEWHLPRFNVNFSTVYIIGDKITLDLDILARDGVYARLNDGSSKHLDGTFDINIGANYKFSKYLTFFCNLNNLANIKYQQYYLYPSYGFNGKVGAILTF